MGGERRKLTLLKTLFYQFKVCAYRLGKLINCVIKGIEMGQKCGTCSLKVRQEGCWVSRSCRAAGRGAGQGGAWPAALRLPTVVS